MNHRLLFIISFSVLIASCSPAKYIRRSARTTVLNDAALQTAHVGISIYEPATGKYWYNYQGDKYFVPASNTKLPTCYAAMKYLGDSLVSLRVSEYDDQVFVFGNGDPSFLHPDFKQHPAYNFLKTLGASGKSVSFGSGDIWKEHALGSGWAWSDYDANYMPERSQFPIYGNVVTFSGNANRITTIPSYFASRVQQSSTPGGYLNRATRSLYSNDFQAYADGKKQESIQVPFITSDSLSFRLLMDTLHLSRTFSPPGRTQPTTMWQEKLLKKYVVHSQPTDSLLKPMMHRSDNFYAEQSLLMVSNELLGVMNDARIIDTLLKSDFKRLPQRPRWVDGSGLSRYNLFTPQDFVFILDKMRSDFGMERIKNILPTGNDGTLGGRFVNDSGCIFAKTGSLSGVISLSGFLYTKQNKLLIFSVLVNNHNASASQVRTAVERFISGVRNKY